MDKLKMQSPDLVEHNIDRIAELFPNCITEERDEKGQMKRAVDFDLLRQELSPHLVEGPRERYTLSWPGKNEAILTANAPIAKTLRPCEEESVDFENTRNLFIEGDNLDVLKLLQETYLGKVKMIYIDPPYNTGNDFIYDDDFAEDTDTFLKRSNQKDEEGNRLVANTEANGRFHSDWLSMMYPRLKLARNLLREDGIIFISIDDVEVQNMRKICDELFGEKCFVANAVWQKAYVANMTAKFISNTHDHILIYCKDPSKLKLGRFDRTQDQINKFKNPDNDPRGPWKAENLSAGKFYAAGQFAIKTLSGDDIFPPPGRYWRCNEETYLTWLKEGRISFGISGNGRPMLKKYLSEVQDGLTPDTWWHHKEFGSNKEASIQLKEMFEGQQTFDTPKPLKLLKKLVGLANDNNSIFLDFFAGSCPLTQAIFETNNADNGNRKFIMVQIPESCDEKSEAFKAGYKTIAEIGKERIRRAGKKIKEEGGDTTKDLDIGFRVFKVDTSNMKDVYYSPSELKQGNLDLFKDHIKPGRRPEDLLFQVFLEWGLDLSLPISRETIDRKTIFFVDTDALLACFDFGITEELVKKLAKRKPLRAVFCDDAFGSDSLKINVEQIFKTLSPSTEVKCL